ncbi:short chain dehydrogenase [Bradyrhizobium arachidis]|nr:short chain dehydrogenase [Bradyrhizobium arachidis]
MERDLGNPAVVIHNAVGGAFGTFREIDPSILNRNFQVNTMGLLYLARRFVPAMVTAGKGAIVATGNTSALRGKAGFAGFAPTKAAQRILAEAMARDLGPQAVHVAYVVVDAVIDLEWTRKRWPDRPDDFFIKPRAIADEIWHVAHQDQSAWSFNVELRPFGESWWREALRYRQGVADYCFRSGETFVCEPGLQGTWEVTVPLRKAFVARSESVPCNRGRPYAKCGPGGFGSSCQNRAAIHLCRCWRGVRLLKSCDGCLFSPGYAQWCDP